ncbi:uncharacterized protein LOC106652872 isoform X2 [Trichogramma pretiosum]|uniref:uncharacterized protein LOC106652872 isoform X2 n=1 Tax=Trichogramma pretiosum TaxID=7493 RepID=UPI0006C97447|nr:uncharacterized protein LOC106652872 isoform X2 [Trichogramma pretiosum]
MKSDIAQIQHRVDQLRKATDRIKREIEEVTEREHELRTCGSIKTLSLDLVDSKVRRISEVTQLGNGRLKRATSTPHILEHHNRSSTQQQQQATKKMTNGVMISSTRNGSNAGSLGQHHHHQPLRFAQSPSQKGLMHRFLATRGKIYTSPGGVATADSREALPRPTITLNPESIKALNRSLEMRNNNNNNNNNNDNGSPKKYAMDDEPKLPPTRKNFVPVEKKIQKELSEMRERENELRLMRSQMLAKSQPNLADIGTDTDSDIYDGSASSLRSGASSSNLTEDDAMTISMPAEKENKIVRHKPHPRRRSNLIEKWESLIAAKKQASENGSDNANTV